MSGVELGFAIVAMVDLCFKHGSNLVRVCSSVKGAESEVAERALCIESHWTRTRIQLEFLRRIWQTLDDDHQSVQIRILQVLIGKLTIASSRIESVLVVSKKPESTVGDSASTSHGVKRLKYVLLKDGLDKTIEDLETWQKMFDPSWYMILMTSSPQIDTALTRHIEASASSSLSLLNSTQTLRNSLRGTELQTVSIFLPEDGLKSARIQDIPFSSLKLAQRAGSAKLLVLDSFPCPAHGSFQQLTTDIRELARKLSHAEPTQFGLLKCYGVIRETPIQKSRPSSFTFVFRTVEGYSPPQSLRAHLLAGVCNHSLSDRLEIARDLAKSISFVHTFGFVHKNVRPENILICSIKASSLGHSFLAGFEEFRNAEGRTLRYSDAAWERELYRHPERQGTRPEQYYTMQHDIYSLGVCLLEIGLWESFVTYPLDGTCVPSPSLIMLSQDIATWQSVTNIASAKTIFEAAARDVLPKRMGTKYAKVVETCLTCLDVNNEDFGDEREFQDADGVLVGVRYIEKVGWLPQVYVRPLRCTLTNCRYFCNLMISQYD